MTEFDFEALFLYCGLSPACIHSFKDLDQRLRMIGLRESTGFFSVNNVFEDNTVSEQGYAPVVFFGFSNDFLV